MSTSLSLFVLSGLVLRWAVSLGSHSGEHNPPIYGDYEAQRHWQEITVNLPVKEWYRNSSANNLLYWGLDYPPLTAYHSWLCGKVAQRVNPSWVELRQSRGIENYEHKFFMRCTVLAADVFILIPAIIVFIKTQRTINMDKSDNILLAFLYPGLILIDHGHFQYNNISLGLFVFAMAFFIKKSTVIGAVFFCLALNYKQMELFHSLPVFFYLLGISFKNDLMKCIQHITLLGITVLSTFAICWFPFLNDSAIDVFHRLFPTGRGVYEDKVANVWCAVSPIIKLKELFNQQQMLMVCAVTTFMMSLPSCILSLWKPTAWGFKYSCVSCSLAFFLFSYQVHEKSILIPAISACLLLNDSPAMVFQFLQISSFSMFPLLVKDGLTMQYFAIKLIFTISALWYCNLLTVNKMELKFFKSLSFNFVSEKSCRKLVIYKILFTTLLTDVVAICSLFVEPPTNLPDIWPVVIAALSCAGFIKCFIYFTAMQYYASTSKIKTN